MPSALLRHRVGAAIRRERERQGLNQTELGRAAGVAQNTLSKYESGDSPIPVDVLEQIARALSRPVGSFLPVEEQPLDVRGLSSLLAELDPEQRAALIEGVLAMLDAWQRHGARPVVLHSSRVSVS